MIYYSKYAEKKFEILNKYKVYFTKEAVEDAILHPEKTDRKNKYHRAAKDNLKVLYTQENDIIKVITFYPIRIK